MSAGLGQYAERLEELFCHTRPGDVLTEASKRLNKVSFGGRPRIDRMCPLQIHLDSLKIDLEKLH